MRPLAALVLCAALLPGCGSSATASSTAFNPVVAQPAPQAGATPLDLQVRLEPGKGTLAARLEPGLTVDDSTGLEGHGVLTGVDGTTRPLDISGGTSGGDVWFRAFPDDSARTTDIVSVGGQLNGEGVWSDSSDGSHGTCTLSSKAAVQARFLDGTQTGRRVETLDVVCVPEGQEFEVRLTVGLTPSRGAYAGRFTANVHLGLDPRTATDRGRIVRANRYERLADIFLESDRSSGGRLVFRVPDDRVGASEPLSTDSYLYLDGPDLVRIKSGTVTVRDRGL